MILGIDLGTSNTCAAYYRDGRCEVIHNQAGLRTFPSAVLFEESGSVLVGDAARRKAVLYPERTILGAKRLIGRAYNSHEVRTIAPMCSYKVVSATNGDAWIEVGGRPISPVEVKAHVLATVRDSATQFFGQPVTDAVITVPAFFDETQRQAVRDAAEIAGMRAVRILSEPTAAALAFGYSQNQRRNVVVFDLGGGTFDVTVIAIETGKFEVLATDGDILLGGSDFDRLLVNRFAEDIFDEHGIDPLKDVISRQRLLLEAERVKKELTDFEYADSSLGRITDGECRPFNFKRRSTQSEYFELVQPLIERLTRPCASALFEAGIRIEDVDEVLAVGGMTQSPPVIAAMMNLFGRSPLAGIDPDETVAMGAATHAAVLDGQLSKKTIIDVAPRGLGIADEGGELSSIIYKSTPLPARVEKIVQVGEGNLTRLEILQGEDRQAATNRSLATIDLSWMQLSPGDSFKVTFMVSEEGRLSALIEDPHSGAVAEATIRPSSGLTRDDIEQLKAALASGELARSDTGSVSLSFG